MTNHGQTRGHKFVGFIDQKLPETRQRLLLLLLRLNLPLQGADNKMKTNFDKGKA